MFCLSLKLKGVNPDHAHIYFFKCGIHTYIYSDEVWTINDGPSSTLSTQNFFKSFNRPVERINITGNVDPLYCPSVLLPICYTAHPTYCNIWPTTAVEDMPIRPIQQLLSCILGSRVEINNCQTATQFCRSEGIFRRSDGHFS